MLKQLITFALLLSVISVTQAKIGWCSVWGDPHFTNVWAKKFNNQAEGTLQLARTRTITAHVVDTKWSKGTTVITNVAIRASCPQTGTNTMIKFNGHWTINGRRMSYHHAVRVLRNKSIKLYRKRIQMGRGWFGKKRHLRSGYILKNGHEYVEISNIVAFKGRKAVARRRARLATNYINVSIYGNHRHYGLCANKVRKGTGLFSKPHPIVRHNGRAARCHRKIKAHATRICRKLHGRFSISACVFDACAGLSARNEVALQRWTEKMERQIEEQEEEEEEEEEEEGENYCESVPEYVDNVEYCPAAQARANALRRCRHRNRFVYYSCVYDHAIGIFHTKGLYDRLAKMENARRRSASRRYSCYSVGDPHVHAFAGRKFNIYNTNGWRTMFNKNGLRIRTHMTTASRWGRQSINNYVEIVTGGQKATFKPWGRTSHCNNYRRVKNSRNWKRWTRTYAGKAITIDWRRSPRGGYISVYVTSSLHNAGGCTGYCCNAKTNRHRFVRDRRLKNGNPRSIRFKDECARKTTAYRRCRVYKTRSRILRCVRNRRNL